MLLSSLQLERSFFKRVEIVAASAAETVPPQKIETTVNSGRDPGVIGRYRIDLIIRLLPEGDKSSSYTGVVEVSGFFRIVGPISPDKQDQLVTVNGCSMLFGMAREMVSNVTARGPWPMLVLPTVSFADVKLVPVEPAHTR